MGTRFLLIDAISSYNIIMGRPWIHQMLAVPSSYHQTLKFPTKWGIKKTKGDQNLSRECYRAGFKKPESTEQLQAGAPSPEHWEIPAPEPLVEEAID